VDSYQPAMAARREARPEGMMKCKDEVFWRSEWI
jgi:hypothetical protein